MLPSAYGPVEVTDLATASAGFCATGVVVVPEQTGSTPARQTLLPVAVAVLSTVAASMSAWVRVYAPVQTSAWPAGISAGRVCAAPAMVQASVGSLVSTMLTPVAVPVPVLLVVMV